eukprot:m.7406 g.7406  ORF g.7406 m.7406 type:complete len:525 (-) comp5759_c0_seq1:116-1690(-)
MSETDKKKELEEYERMLEQQALIAARRASGFQPQLPTQQTSYNATPSQPPPPPPTQTPNPVVNASKEDEQKGDEEKDDGRRRRRSRSRDRRDSRRRRSRSREGRRKRSRSRDRRRSSRRNRSREDRRRGDRRERGGERSDFKSVRQWPSKSWDVPPLGYSHLSTNEYKEKLATDTLPPPIYTQTEMLAAQTSAPLPTRQLVVTGFPPDTNSQQIKDLFRDQMLKTRLILQPGNPIENVTIDGSKATMEFRSVDECTNCLVFNYMPLRGQLLQLERPDDYERPKGHIEKMPLSVTGPTAVTSMVQDSPHKIYIGNIPNYLTDEQVREIISAFGELRMFKLISDATTGLSKGYAFAEFVDTSITETMIAALNGWQIGERNLVVQRASVGKNPMTKPPGPPGMMPHGAPHPSNNPPVRMGIQVTRVVVLMNMVDESELRDDDEYEDICLDVREECAKFGNVEGLKAPRPSPDLEAPPLPGVGKLYVKYSTEEEAKLAGDTLAGRQFANKSVIVSYWDPEKFDKDEFE